MTTKRNPRPDFTTLEEFARGRLSQEESLRVLDWVENDPDVSRDLELVLALMGLSREEWERREKSAT